MDPRRAGVGERPARPRPGRRRTPSRVAVVALRQAHDLAVAQVDRGEQLDHHLTDAVRGDVHEVAEQRQARSAGLLRVELRREHVAAPERGVDDAAVVARGRDHVRIVGHGVQRVHEVHPRLGRGRPANIGSSGNVSVEHVPLHLRPLHARRQPADRARDHAEPGAPRRPPRCRRTASACRRRCRGTAGPSRPRRVPASSRSGVAQRVHARPERADAGQHDGVGVGDQSVVGGEPGVGAAVLQRLLRRAQVADAVVEHGDQRLLAHRHSTPFVDGTCAPSTRTASRRHRARPLNAASMM